MADRKHLPQLLDGEGNLKPQTTSDFSWLLARAVYELQDRVKDLEAKVLGTIVSGPSTTVVGVSGLVFIDITLTGPHTVTPPAAADDSILIWTFDQVAPGNHVVTWPATFAQQYFVGPTAGRATVIVFRKQIGPVYNLIWSGPVNRISL